MRADLVTIVGPPGTHIPDNDKITPPSISSRQANVFMHLLLSLLGPKPEPAHPEMPSTTLVRGAGMQRARHAAERPVNVGIYR